MIPFTPSTCLSFTPSLSLDTCDRCSAGEDEHALERTIKRLIEYHWRIERLCESQAQHVETLENHHVTTWVLSGPRATLAHLTSLREEMRALIEELIADAPL